MQISTLQYSYYLQLHLFIFFLKKTTVTAFILRQNVPIYFIQTFKFHGSLPILSHLINLFFYCPFCIYVTSFAFASQHFSTNFFFSSNTSHSLFILLNYFLVTSTSVYLLIIIFTYRSSNSMKNQARVYLARRSPYRDREAPSAVYSHRDKHNDWSRLSLCDGRVLSRRPLALVAGRFTPRRMTMRR